MFTLQRLVVVCSVNSTDAVCIDNYQEHVNHLRSRNAKGYFTPGQENTMREFDESRYSVHSVVANFMRMTRELRIVDFPFRFPGARG